MGYLTLAYGNQYADVLSKELVCIDASRNWSNWEYVINTIAVLLISFVLQSALRGWPFDECFGSFTDWTMWLTASFVFLCTYAHRDREIEHRPVFLGVLHTIFTLTAICNSIVMLIYWPFLH